MIDLVGEYLVGAGCCISIIVCALMIAYQLGKWAEVDDDRG